MDTFTGRREPVRVLLIDNSIFTLQGLKTFLLKSSCIVVVGTARTEAEAFASIGMCRPDVVVLDVRVGRANGIDMCRAIRESHPNIGVLFFTQHDDKNLLHAAILAGAQGYLLKTAAADAVVKSIEIVATGQAITDQRLTQQVITWLQDGNWESPGNAETGCSKDDRHVLSLVASGKTNKEIAQILNVEPRAVATRLQKIYKRLRISRRSEAARYYVCLEKSMDGLESFSH
ncbi:MAG: response regulator transcription factor [Nitrospira sp.]|nr:response regulator transcription factor [Nitrospira sp.]